MKRIVVLWMVACALLLSSCGSVPLTGVGQLDPVFGLHENGNQIFLQRWCGDGDEGRQEDRSRN